ncbi:MULTISPECIES: isopeptide-forming domain-containing fimbrial protein [unclassified Enterococcus]|uniref:isopeptide-forming domain-containing fimbrial protein n=1 Tax=unclassified Enterococcus TaxID=2608891 RepID=UPI001CE1D3D5|nr:MULTISPECIES: isopeptide-forming domain-containing fimbrial protein [unclassified Enterococcus]MCA5013864.1 isopeptide-forming domain-containing fimbrial protein [Enterococcus sp. S23]MCA5017362.1 isopeptide-forming domain-containing fimbrial protein [Enterococcus sp. S22(2020)]
MKIGKKSYLTIALVLLVSIFSTLLLKNSTPMKASEERYSIETETVNAAGQIPVKITIAEPIDEELTLSLEGFDNLDAADLNNGVLEEDKKNIVIEDTDDIKIKRITTKVSEKPVQITFFANKDGQSESGKITLLNVAQEVLSSTKVEFAADESTLVDKIVAKSLALTPTADATTEQNVGPVPATAEEKAAANAAANTRFGFDPLQNEATVGTWADFKLAYQDNSVTKITMTQNISNRAVSGTAGNLGERSKSIEIDGGGFLLDLNDQTLRLANTPTDGIGFVHVHNMSIKQNVTDAGYNGGTYSWAFIMGNNGTGYARNWYFRVGDIRSFEEVNGEKVARLIRGTRSEITVYGKMTLYTTSENFYAGSVIIEDGTEWYGVNTTSPWSLVWYEQNSSGTDTGAAQKYIVGKRSYVYLQNRGNNPTYPSVYSYYKELEVGENSIYNANMAGNSVRFDNPGVMTVKANAVVNLLSRGTGEVLQYSSNDASVVVEPTGSLYIVGNTTGGVVGLNGGSNRSLTLNSPKGYDIRNRNNSGRAIAVTAVATQTFNLTDSDIDLWNVGKDMAGPSQETYALVTNFSSTGTNVITTSEPGLQSFRFTNYRRITGMNAKPTMEWTPVTDADKTYQAKVKIGMTPSDEFDENGNVKLIPVYASKDQASVTYTDTYNETHTASTLDGGLAPFTDTKFNIAGKQISAHAVRGPWISEPDEATTVIDVTPPEPAVVTGGKVTNGMKQLTGEGAEPKAKIYLDINGVRQSVVGLVNDDGTWTYNLPHYLEKGDVIQIFLEDNAGKITEAITPAAPSTNSDAGNINPATDMTYRDATFKAATKYTVEDVLPDKPSMDKTVVSSGGATTQVGDTLTYTLTAKNNKEATYTTLWKNVIVTDTLPEGLDFDPATAEIKIDGVTAETPNDYSYDPDSRVLTVKLGDLATGDSSVITFKATVASSAVGTVISNTATVVGDSPRETPFVEGPNDPDATHETYTATSQKADSPGGTVFGVLELASAPTEIDFGSAKYQGKTTRINSAQHHGADLVVKDSRANKKGWTLTAKLTTPMTSTNPDVPAYTLDGALKYVYNNNEITLNGGAQDIMIQDANASTAETTYNISDTWSASGDGFKFETAAQDVKALGTYQGEILWELGDTP